MKHASSVVLIFGLASPAVSLGAQSLLYRPPNLGGTWVPDAAVVQFNFVHRFYVSEGPANNVQNFPTFTFASGLGHGLGLGWRFATNSVLVGPGRQTDNESEWFVRWRPAGAEGRSGLTVAITAAYNQLAQSGDGEIGVDYTVGRLTLSGAGRGMTHPFRGPHAKAAVAGGFVARLTDYVAVGADIGSRLGPTTRAAWSAGINVLIPGSPHTFSLQASNAVTSTIQGNSRGLVNPLDGSTRVLYGFEFTIPLHLKRFTPWFKGRPKPVALGGAAGAAVAAEVRMAAFKFQSDSVVISTGQAVRWANHDPVEHTVTFDGPEPASPPIPANGTFSHRFDKPGTYTYHCTPHPYMKGVVVVR